VINSFDEKALKNGLKGRELRGRIENSSFANQNKNCKKESSFKNDS